MRGWRGCRYLYPKCNGTYLQEGFTYLCFLSISRCGIIIIIFIDSPVSCECLLCFHNNICTPYRNLVVHQPTKKRVNYGNEWWERQFNSPFRVSWWCGEVVEIIWFKKNLILIDHSVTYSLLVGLHQTIIFFKPTFILSDMPSLKVRPITIWSMLMKMTRNALKIIHCCFASDWRLHIQHNPPRGGWLVDDTTSWGEIMINPSSLDVMHQIGKPNKSASHSSSAQRSSCHVSGSVFFSFPAIFCPHTNFNNIIAFLAKLIIILDSGISSCEGFR